MLVGLDSRRRAPLPMNFSIRHLLLATVIVAPAVGKIAQRLFPSLARRARQRNRRHGVAPDYLPASRNRCGSWGMMIFSMASFTAAGLPGMVSRTLRPRSPPTARLRMAAGPISW